MLRMVHFNSRGNLAAVSELHIEANGNALLHDDRPSGMKPTLKKLLLAIGAGAS